MYYLYSQNGEASSFDLYIKAACLPGIKSSLSCSVQRVHSHNITTETVRRCWRAVDIYHSSSCRHRIYCCEQLRWSWCITLSMNAQLAGGRVGLPAPPSAWLFIIHGKQMPSSYLSWWFFIQPSSNVMSSAIMLYNVRYWIFIDTTRGDNLRGARDLAQNR